jgi:hypothetical protein
MNSIHIQLEKADDAKNWELFKQILNTDKDYLLFHLNYTKNIFKWHIYDLPIEQQNEILN